MLNGSVRACADKEPNLRLTQDFFGRPFRRNYFDLLSAPQQLLRKELLADAGAPQIAPPSCPALSQSRPSILVDTDNRLLADVPTGHPQHKAPRRIGEPNTLNSRVPVMALIRRGWPNIIVELRDLANVLVFTQVHSC